METTPLTSETDALVFTDAEVSASSFTSSGNNHNMIKPKKKPMPILPTIGAITFGLIYMIPIMQEHPAAHSTFAILFLAAFLWGTEAIPAYATSYLVPLFSVWFGVGLDTTTKLRYDASSLATRFASKFMDPVIFVFLGSMTMSDCLSKLNITDRVSGFVFRRLSKRPAFILLVLMLLNLFIGAFLSNVASTTLVLTFTMPIIRSLDPDDPFIKALLLGIAWSGNCGGMPTTIASPQNIMALDCLKNYHSSISFMEWIYFAVPTSLVICIFEWVYLILRYKSNNEFIIIPEPTTQYPPWSYKHSFVSIITILTILLWTLEDELGNILGAMGITSLIPVISFFGSGIMTVVDFHTIRWSTLSLMGGGLCLGEAMTCSGLLDLVNQFAGPTLSKISLWPLLIIFLAFEGLLGSLINSTSAASILYPLIAELGKGTHHPMQMVVLSALMISGAQLFHISSFPNALVSGVCRHQFGNPEKISQQTFLQGNDFPIIGWPTMLISMLTISSIGFGITKALNID